MKDEEPVWLQVIELEKMLPDVMNAVATHGVRYIVTRHKVPMVLLAPVPEELMRPERIPIPGRKKTEAA